MLRFYWLALLGCALVVAGGCRSTKSCPPGEHRMLGTNDCVVDGVDGGVPDAGEHDDAEVDAGPCGACSGDTPLCRVDDGACVACLSNEDCGSTAVLCNDAGECVGCLTDNDCANPTPVCNEGTCTGCTSHADCAERDDDALSCDASTGRCEACTPDTEEERCGAFSCSSVTLTCTTTMRGLLDTCDPCEADSECQTGRKCVMHTFDSTDVGYFCFLDSADGGCGDSDMARRPYSTRTELSSIDGFEATYCMPPVTTTCEGIRDTQSTSCTMDTDCGVDELDDGYCPTGGTGMGLCAYRCGGAVDCRDPLSCGGTPGHCRP